MGDRCALRADQAPPMPQLPGIGPWHTHARRVFYRTGSEIGQARSSSRKAPVKDDKILTVLGPDTGIPPIILGFLYSKEKQISSEDSE